MAGVVPQYLRNLMASWNRGDRVRQANYGRGTVLDVDDQHVVIHFDDAGRRKFAIDRVVLEVTGESARPPLMGKLPPMPRSSGGKLDGTTTTVGFRNVNGQTVLRETNLSGNLDGQRVYVLMCGHCAHQYGANGCDIHIRKCPACMDGQPGLAY
jgi:hypothetical protein